MQEEYKNSINKVLPISEWYKNRIIIWKILNFIWLWDKTIQEYSLNDFRKYIQHQIDDEWKDI